MTEAYFGIYQTNQKVSINLEQIVCAENNHVPTLRIPVRLDLNLIKGRKYVLLNAEFSLQVGFDKILSKVTVYSYRQIVQDNTYEYLYPEFEIDESKLHLIESKRMEGVPFQINYKFHFALYDEIPSVDSKNRPIVKQFVSEYYSTDSSHQYLNINISQSQWVNKILPKLGDKQYRLIELPIFNDVIPESYSKSLNELVNATKYFKNGDWDKVVSHCRSAIEPIKSELPNIKAIIESESGFKWFKTLNEKTYDWLEVCLGSTMTISNKTHHAPSTGHFTRSEAQIVLMITTSLIAYAGQLTNRNM